MYKNNILQSLFGRNLSGGDDELAYARTGGKASSKWFQAERFERGK